MNKYNLKDNALLTIFMVILMTGLSLVLYGGYLMADDYLLEKKAVKTTARIEEMNYNQKPYIAKVTYEASGEKYEQSIEIEREDASVNDYIELKYDGTNPGKLIYNNHTTQAIIVASIGVVLLIIGIKEVIDNTKKRKDITELKKSGIFITATIKDVFIDKNQKTYKGQYPYRIRAEYLNPSDNQLYLFDSENYYEDLKSIIENNNIQTISVYINRDNTNVYYVDVEPLLPKLLKGKQK